MATLMQAFHDIKPQRIEIGKFYTGVVVENNDKKIMNDKLPLGRIQFRIETLFDGIKDEFLPWAMPIPNRYKGGKNNGEFSVPQKGAKVFITFQSNDVYSPFYLGYPYARESSLDILTADKADADEYPKKQVIYSFDSGSHFTINNAYKDPELKDKLSLKNTGNAKLWFGKNYDHYVKDNFDLNVDKKLEVHSNKKQTNIIVHTDLSFNAKLNSNALYEGVEIEEVRGLSTHTYVSKAERHFAKGAFVKVTKGSFIISIDGSTFSLNSKGTVSISTEKDVSISGATVTIAAAKKLRLRGGSITKSTQICFEDGVCEEQYIRNIVRQEIASYMRAHPYPTVSRRY